jgi:hypothetical protein
MTLHVPLASFAELARTWGVKQAFVQATGDTVTLSAAHPTLDRLLLAKGKGVAEEFKSDLRTAGLEALTGTWNGVESLIALEEGEEDWPYVASVSFVSSEDVPGVWVDAYRELPAQVTVLRRLFDDFRSTGELEDVAFEEFVRLARPNVVIVSPADLREYVREQEIPDCPPVTTQDL